jgi:hypothetical protein
MENIYVHLLSDFDSVFKITEKGKCIYSVSTVESLANEIDLEIKNPLNFEINVYPIKKQSKNLFSYTVNFYFQNNNLYSENEYVKIYKLPEQHYIIKFFPLGMSNTEVHADKLEVKNNEIKALSLLNDMAGRAKVEILKVDNEKIVKENEYFVYIGEESEKEIVSELMLLSFFEAYSANDFSTCISYLSNDFASKLDKESLKDFFGKFNSCHLVNYYSYPAIVLLRDDGASIYSASTDRNYITNIYEVN